MPQSYFKSKLNPALGYLHGKTYTHSYMHGDMTCYSCTHEYFSMSHMNNYLIAWSHASNKHAVMQKYVNTDMRLGATNGRTGTDTFCTFFASVVEMFISFCSYETKQDAP